MYQYKATVLRVLDADTLHVRLDMGCDVGLNMTLRLAGIDAPEQRTPEGKAATAFVRDWLRTESDHIVINTIKDRREKFGRYLAVIYRGAEPESLNDALLRTGHAVPYEGGHR